MTKSPLLRDRAATEARIVAAAEGLLLTHGWIGLNIQTLAAEARVDRKLVYRYFDGIDGVVDRVSGRMDLWLSRTLGAAPASGAEDYRAFLADTLVLYLRALRANPLIVRLLAWELTQDTPLLRRIEARRSDIVQTWLRDRRPRLRTPPQGDVTALNAVLMASVQHLVLAAAARGRFTGLDLDEAGWLRVETAVARLADAWPD